MAKIKRIVEVDENGSDPIFPKMGGNYKLACCDCGLVHDIEFYVVEILERHPNGFFAYSEPLDNERYQVMFKAKRNNRSTSNMRRKKP